MPVDMQSTKVPLKRSHGERGNVHTQTNASHTADEVLVAEAVLEAGVDPLGHEREKHMTEVVMPRNAIPPSIVFAMSPIECNSCNDVLPAGEGGVLDP